MTTTELLTEPELTPIIEAYFETDADFKKAANALRSVYLNLGRSYDGDRDAELAADIAAFEQAAADNLAAAELGRRLADFHAAGVYRLAVEFSRAQYRYHEQQRDIADAPRRAWAAAYNARLAEIDKQIKGAKIRRGKAWGRWSKNEIDFATANALAAVIDGEIEALQARREIAAAERFESVAA